MSHEIAISPLQSAPPIGEYPSGDIYRMLSPLRGGRKTLQTKNRQQLAETYNASPQNIGDIVIHDTLDADSAPIVVVNPSLIGQNIKLRDSAIANKRHTAADDEYEFSDQQVNERDIPQPRQFKNLGYAAAAGAAVIYPAMKIAEMSEPYYGGVSGLFTGTLLYQTGKYIERKRTIEKATETYQAFSAWIDDPDNGAITFAGHSGSGKSAGVEDVAILELTNETLTEAHQSSEWLPPIDDIKAINEFRGCLAVRPGQLVRQLLTQDYDPNDLWIQGFGDKVQSLASTESQLMQIRKTVDNIIKRHEFSGFYAAGDEAQLASLAANAESLQHDMLTTSLSMVGQCMERQKAHQHAQLVEKNTALIKQAINGPVENVHPQYEMDIQALCSAASEALTTVDLSSEETTNLVNDFGAYINEARSIITHPDQIEQFYRGMQKKFKDQTPTGFKDWDEFTAERPTA